MKRNCLERFNKAVIKTDMLSNNIKGFVSSRNESARTLAKACGLQPTALYRFIDDPEAIPGKNILFRLCKYYKLTPGYLIEFKSEQ